MRTLSPTCVYGHQVTGVYKSGRRYCKTCAAARVKLHRAKKKISTGGSK